MTELKNPENFNISEGNVKENNIFYKDCCDKFIDYVKKSHNEQDLERVADTSKTLTDKLKAEELYYVKKKNGEIVKRQAHLYSCLRTENSMPFVYFEDNDIEKVMALMPSYNEYNRLKEVERKKGKLVNVNYKIKQENKHLKDIISKMCMELVDPDDDMSYGLAEYFKQELILEIHEVLK